MAIKDLEVPLDRDMFFRKMIRSFAGSLEETVGLDEAAGYVAVVGSELGSWIEEEYKKSAGTEEFTPEQVAKLLVDLKSRIGGDFYVISVDEEKIVLGNRECPFGKLAEGRPSLCQMTSNVFGRITANQLGYARIGLDETIATGSPQCHITIHLTPGDESEEHHEFFRIEEPLA
ncbi:MAG: methanogen output domain 1-containing protein [Sphingomonadaceae bacterium]